MRQQPRDHVLLMSHTGCPQSHDPLAHPQAVPNPMSPTPILGYGADVTTSLKWPCASGNQDGFQEFSVSQARQRVYCFNFSVPRT